MSETLHQRVTNAEQVAVMQAHDECLAMAKRRTDRLWLDRVNAHGPELLDALKQLARNVVASTEPARDALHRACCLIDKLESKP